MLFYDYEVFKNDWMVVVMDMVNQQEHVIINDRERLRQLHDENEGQIWVGYNNKRYDQYIHKAILSDINPKLVNDFIIEQDNPGYMYAPDLFNRIEMINYDVMEFNDGGLKKLEAFMGHDIRESSVPFDIDRKLTEDEIQDTVSYCRHDVQETVEVFLRRKGTFEARLGLVKMATEKTGLDLTLLERSDAQLSAYMLGARKRERDDEFDISLPKTLKLDKYKHVADWYMNPINQRYNDENGKKNQYIVDVAGVPHVFGWGGVHAARSKYVRDGDFLLMDVRSLYPSLMLVYDLQSRNINDKTIFENIYDQRIKWKAEGNKLQEPLKLVLNTTYGAMKDFRNQLYDPRQANLVCIYGQLLLLDLIEKLEPYIELVQSNTDGILVRLLKSEYFEIIDDIVHEWETRTGLVMEFNEYKRVVQKDVNNYVIVDLDGGYESTGGYVMGLHDLKYDLPIVNKALINLFVNDTPIETTINENDNLRDFQLIARIGSKFSHLELGSEKLDEKCVRLFASKSPTDSQLRKHHIRTNKAQRYQGSPEKSFVYNNNVIDKKIDDRVDKMWYNELARKRAKDFGFVI